MSLSEAQQQPIKQKETTEIVADEQVVENQPIKKKRSKKVTRSEQAVQEQQTRSEQAVQQQQQGFVQQPDNNRSKAPRLRLDLNLDAEIHLKAKVHGDITLTLLS